MSIHARLTKIQIFSAIVTPEIVLRRTASLDRAGIRLLARVLEHIGTQVRHLLE